MRRNGTIDAIKSLAVFVALGILSIVLVINNGTVQRYRVLSFSRSVNIALWKALGGAHGISFYKAENDRLAAENLALMQEVAFCRAAETLQRTVTDGRGYRFIPAKVVKNATNMQNNFLILDVGTDNGISDGMGVVTGNGVVGIVEAADRHYCRVSSFLSASQSASVKISRTQAFGPLSWSGTGIRKAHITEIPTHAEVTPGDTVVTSGFSAIFPPEIPVGTVTGVTSDGIYNDVAVDLLLDFNSLQHVFVVLNLDREEINGLL